MESFQYIILRSSGSACLFRYNLGISLLICLGEARLVHKIFGFMSDTALKIADTLPLLLTIPSHEMSIAESVTSLTLNAPPSCIEFSTLFSNVFVVGTYVLEQDGHTSTASEARSNQTRHGQLIYFRLNGDKM